MPTSTAARRFLPVVDATRSVSIPNHNPSALCSCSYFQTITNRPCSCPSYIASTCMHVFTQQLHILLLLPVAWRLLDESTLMPTTTCALCYMQLIPARRTCFVVSISLLTLLAELPHQQPVRICMLHHQALPYTVGASYAASVVLNT
jgi:hypothetical protein